MIKYLLKYFVFLPVFCIVMLVSFYAYSVPAGYIGHNKFCVDYNSLDEIIVEIVDSDVVVTPQALSIVELEKLAQNVNVETITYPIMPFSDTIGVPFSDTWGVCAVFGIGATHSNINGPNNINNQSHIDQWDTLTSSLAPLNHLRLIVVDQVNWDGTTYDTGFLAVAKPLSKLVLIESSFVPGAASLLKNSKLVMHEWGHTQDCYLCGGTYFWGPHTHYRGTNYLLNVMLYKINDISGRDGDIAFKFGRYPWVTPWWNSKRINENF